MTSNINGIIDNIRKAIQHSTQGMIGREQLAELVVLAAVAHEHLLVIGPPGTAKSAVVRRVSQTLGGRYFEYLLGRFTEPSELFGAVDLKKLKEGKVETDITGMLPEADIVFLDEVFLGSTAILNTLLGILNERRFKRGHTDIISPLKVCIGAANSLPDDPNLAAFSDRFLIHLFIDLVPDHQLEAMLEGGWASSLTQLSAQLDIAQLDELHLAVKNVDLTQVRPLLANAVRSLRNAGITLSDRRIVRVQHLIAAATVLNNREIATQQDLWPLLYVLPTEDAQQQGREILRQELSLSMNSRLFSSVEEATLQPQSRMNRLIERATDVLNAEPVSKADIELTLREIDANFSTEMLSEELAILRTQLAIQFSHLL